MSASTDEEMRAYQERGDKKRSQSRSLTDEEEIAMLRGLLKTYREQDATLRTSLAAALEAKGDLVEGLGWILGMALHHPTEDRELLRGRLRGISGKVESLIKSLALSSKGEKPLSTRETQLVEAAQAVLDEHAIEFDDARISYVTVQITRGVLENLRAALLRSRGEIG